VLVEVAIRHRLRLADIVEERGQAQHEVRCLHRVERQERMLEDVLRDGLLLRHTAALLELRADDRQQTELAHEPEPGGRALREEHLRELLVDPLAGQGRREGRVPPDRRSGRRLDLHPEHAREPDAPQHPQRVLTETLGGVADRAQHLAAEIRRAAVRVDELPMAPRHRVHREITPREVGEERVGELDAVGTARVAVVGLDAVRRHLDLALR
jgi:hypothetical protein